MNSFEQLVKIFGEFPGIGPRQARRFVYFLLSRNPDYISTLSASLTDLKKEIGRCASCFRYFTRLHIPGQTKIGGDGAVCSICNDNSRDKDYLMLVAKDTDLLSIEKAGVFNGYYFVIGGLIPILEKNPEQRIRATELTKKVKVAVSQGLKEIIIAFSATNEGENTSLYLEKLLGEDLKTNNIKLTHLGRGLSTGAELEYADTDTLKSALENKK